MTGEQDQCLECLEQARLLGMGAERELKLMAERDALKKELAEALEKAGLNREPALLAQVAFAELTVDLDAKLIALQQLVDSYPDTATYRWQWIRTLIDHGDLTLAAGQLDSTLANTPPPAPIASTRRRSKSASGLFLRAISCPPVIRQDAGRDQTSRCRTRR